MSNLLRVEVEVVVVGVVEVQRMIRLHRRRQIVLQLRRGVVLTHAFDPT